MLNSIGIIEYILFHEIFLRERIGFLEFRHESVFLPPREIRTRANNRDNVAQIARCYTILTWRGCRLRARSGVFIGAVNSSRNLVTLSPASLPPYVTRAVLTSSCSLSETRAPIIPIRFCIVIPKGSTIVLFLVPPHNFSPDDRLFPRPILSPSPPTSFFRSVQRTRGKSPSNFRYDAKIRSIQAFRNFLSKPSRPFFLFFTSSSFVYSFLRFSCILPKLLTRLIPTLYSGNSCRSKTSESRFMGTTLPSDTPQKREYIDRWKEEGVEKAALSASVIKPTGYKYSLSLSVIGNSTSISNRPLSLTWNDISRYILGTRNFFRGIYHLTL